MKKVFLVARYLLGVFVFVFGLNKFIGFMEFPAFQGFAAQYMAVIGGSYILKSMGVIYILSAILLVTGRAVGLATVLLAPIAYNAFMFHLTLDSANIGGALVFVVLIVVVMIGNKEKCLGLLK
ncbi:hypothetical protein N8787_03280 [Opitutaceae bacterium]|nr:hypothetical protein [Opitutaceae bacterium]